MIVTTVRENLPKGDFSVMTEMLKKFLNFMNLTVSAQELAIDQYRVAYIIATTSISVNDASKFHNSFR